MLLTGVDLEQLRTLAKKVQAVIKPIAGVVKLQI
jgi:Cu/Ag efflux pump CusA